MPRRRRRNVVSVEGFNKLADKLEQLPERIATGAENAVKHETDETADDMRRHAPRGETGELKDGIQAEVKGLEGKAVSTARHSTFVEHGTSTMKEQPFVQPAAEQSRTRFPKRLDEEIGQELKDVIK